MRVSLVVAAARNGVIGFRGDIPWHLPNDQRFFKDLTVGHCVVMGRKTFESLPRPLPNRKTIVLTRGTRKFAKGVESARDLSDALDRARALDFEECFIAGGEAVYREGIEFADCIYRTLVDADPVGDTVFPAIDESHWRLIASEPHPVDERHALSFAFETWERVD